jgi:hypothetical protein
MIVSFMVCLLADGSDRCERGPDVGVARATSAPMAELSGGMGVQRREQVLDSLQVRPISPEGDGWRVRSATAATTRTAWATTARVVQRYQERQSDQFGIAELGRDPHRWPPGGQVRGCLQQVVDGDVQCGGEGVQVGVHRASRLDVGFATPIMGTLGLLPHPLESIV